MFTSGWIFLAFMALAYGVGNLLQSVAAGRVTTQQSLDPRFLLKLGGHRIYLYGIVAQVTGAVFAIAARRELPLFLVQSAIGGSIGVTALLGVLFLRWRLPAAEVFLLITLGFGIGGLVSAAEPSRAKGIGVLGAVLLALGVAIIAALARPAAKLRGVPGAVALGALAGLVFCTGAIASRPLISRIDNWSDTVSTLTNPLLYVWIACTLIGQMLLGLAMQRGSTTAAVASMDASLAIPAAIVGLVFLGDQIVPGRGWLATVGFLVTIGSVIGLAFYAEPQRHIDDHLSAAKQRQRPAIPVRET